MRSPFGAHNICEHHLPLFNIR